MVTDFFEFKFGKNSKEFNTVSEVNSFVEKKIGRKLEVKTLHPDICTSRGSIIPIKQLDADKIFEAAINKKCK